MRFQNGRVVTALSFLQTWFFLDSGHSDGERAEREWDGTPPSGVPERAHGAELFLAALAIGHASRLPDRSDRDLQTPRNVGKGGAAFEWMEPIGFAPIVQGQE
jgi:hypothetical protein